MFSEEYLNRKAIEIGKDITLCLKQIHALGVLRNEDRFRYKQLFKKADGLSHRLSRYKISIKRTPLPEDLDNWLESELQKSTAN